MKKLLLAMFLILSGTILSQAQVTPSAAQITAATTNATCVGGTPNGGAVDLTIGPTTGTVGVSITGTWAATLNIQESTDHGKTWTAASPTFAANQQSIINVSGNSDLCVFASAYTSGTAQVTFTQSPASTVTGGGAATGSAASGNPVVTALVDNGNVVRVPCVSTTSIPCSAANVTSADGVAGSQGGEPIAPGNGATQIEGRPYLFNGSTWDRPVKCPTAVAIVVAAAATQQIVAPVAGQKVRVCAMFLAISTAGTLSITEGTGATCGTGTTTIFGQATLATGQTPIFSAGTSVLQTNVSGDGLCLTSGTAAVQGWAQIEQH